MKKLIWLTSGTGFIGKNLSKRLKNEKFEFITTSKKEINLLNANEIKKFLKKEKPKIVIQTAGEVGGIKKNIINRINLLEENLLISTNLIKYSYEYNVDKFINLVSSCIYPKNIKKIQSEEDINIGKVEITNEAYSLSKYTSYKLSNYYFNDLKKNYINVIPSNIYGPHDNFNEEESHVIPSMINKFTNNKKIKLLGSGVAKRDFLFIDDFISAIILLLKQKKYKTNTFNVSSKEIISIKKLAEIIAKLTNNKNYQFLNDGLDGNFFKSLNSKKIKNLGWKEQYTLELGLKKTIKWFLNKKK